MVFANEFNPVNSVCYVSEFPPVNGACGVKTCAIPSGYADSTQVASEGEESFENGSATIEVARKFGLTLLAIAATVDPTSAWTRFGD
jgi:hypothetical protein